jgi:hypothetical protein
MQAAISIRKKLAQALRSAAFIILESSNKLDSPQMTNREALLSLQKCQRALLVIDQTLSLLEFDKTHNGENSNMPVSQQVADLITQFDSATDKIAARIQNLIASSMTLSAADTAALQAEVDKLNLLGQDPNNPVPASVA